MSKNYYETRNRLAAAGYPMYAGNRHECIEMAMQEYGITLHDIIGKISDKDIHEAIEICMERQSMFMNE